MSPWIRHCKVNQRQSQGKRHLCDTATTISVWKTTLSKSTQLLESAILSYKLVTLSQNIQLLQIVPWISKWHMIPVGNALRTHWRQEEDHNRACRMSRIFLQSVWYHIISFNSLQLLGHFGGVIWSLIPKWCVSVPWAANDWGSFHRLSGSTTPTWWSYFAGICHPFVQTCHTFPTKHNYHLGATNSAISLGLSRICTVIPLWVNWEMVVMLGLWCWD